MTGLTLPPALVDRALQDFQAPAAAAVPKAVAVPEAAVSGSRLERLAGLEDTLENFEQVSGIAPLPPTAPADSTGVNDLRVRAVRARLSQLGYRVTRLDIGTIDDELRAAVRLFQQEANVTVDGWVGPETWNALQQLVALEEPLDIAHFYLGGAPYWALVRAVVFRLRALGVPYRAGMTDEQAFHYGLQYFKAVAYQLELLDSTNPPPEPAIIARLFDHGRLVMDLGADNGARVRNVVGAGLKLDRINRAAGASFLQVFLARFVRTELWLAGYDPGGLLTEIDGRTVQPLQRAITSFWMDVGLTQQAAAARKNDLNADLFVAMAQQRQTAIVSPRELSDFVAANADTINKAWQKAMATNPIFFIWDGIQRGIRWLGQQIQKLVRGVVDILTQGVDYVKMLLWNVVRACYDPAAKVISVVRKACATFVRGWGMYLSGEARLRDGNNVSAAWRLRIDGDFAVIAAPGQIQAASAYARQFEAVPRALSITSQILADILDLIVRLGQGPIGWVLLLADLVREAPRFLENVQALAALDDLVVLA